MRNSEHALKDIYPLLLEVIESGGEFRLIPKGTSMRPLLRAGIDSVVLVSAECLKKRDICLYRRADGSFVLHRLIKFDEKGALVFCGDNQLALEYGVPKEAVIARVLAFYRKERRVEISSLGYRLYTKIWCLMPLRWLLFLPRRGWWFLKRRFLKRKK